MTTDSERFRTVIAAVDAANAADPNLIATANGLRPRELVHGELATQWLSRVDPAASELQLIAARAHHLRRWEVPRSSFPEGRAAYLRWRAEQKKRHAELVGELMADAGYNAAEVAEVQRIVRKVGLGSDAATQAHEDAVCLVFLQEEFARFAESQGDDKTIDIVRKTAAKMSSRGIALVAEIEMTPASAELVRRAVAS